MLRAVITTATRTETALDAVPGNASLINRSEIEHTPRASIKELVRGQEGVITGQLRGQSDLAPEITLRGIPNQARTMLLIDGVPVQTSYSGQAQAIGGLSVEDIQQVEIVRGPYSSLYGSSAMGGVVNFITAMPKAREYRASLGYGDAFEQGRAQKQMMKGYLSGTELLSETLKVKLSYGWMDSKGYRSDLTTSSRAPTGGVSGAELAGTTTGGTQYIIGNKGRGALDKYDMSVRAELKPSSRDTVSTWYTRSNLHNQYKEPESYLRNSTGGSVFSAITASASAPIRENAYANTTNDVTNDIFVVDWKHRFADARLSMRYSYLSVDEWYTTAGTTAATTLQAGPGTVTPRTSENNVFDVLLEQPFGETLALFGVQYKTTNSVAETFSLSNWLNENSRSARTTSSGGKEQVYAVFSDWQMPLSERLNVALGGRYEHWKGHDGYTADYTAITNSTLNQHYGAQTKHNFSPKLSSGYQLTDNTKLKASWGTAFRAPDALNLYRNYTLSGTTTYISNPALKPETSVSVDLGLEHTLPSSGIFKTYVFHTDIKDLISTRDANAAGSIKERVNVGKARVQGLEISFVQPLPANLRLNANYTLNDSKVIENSAESISVGKRLPYVPRNMAQLGLGYDDARVYGQINYQYMSKRYMNSSNNDVATGVYGAYDPYSLVAAKLGYRFNRSLDVNLAVSNLFDRKFYNSVITEGRAWFVQANARF
jgi:iron complex outermembrane receptor protein